jgi:hypothetical protein
LFFVGISSAIAALVEAYCKSTGEASLSQAVLKLRKAAPEGTAFSGPVIATVLIFY